jgi:ribosomal protein L35AE/L33A
VVIMSSDENFAPPRPLPALIVDRSRLLTIIYARDKSSQEPNAMDEVNLFDIKSKNIQPPTEKTGEYLPLKVGQTVCTVKDAKGQNCTGHIKEWHTAPPEIVRRFMKGRPLNTSTRRSSNDPGGAPPKGRR